MHVITALYYSSNGNLPTDARERLAKLNVQLKEVNSLATAFNELQSNIYHAFIHRCDEIQESEEKIIREIKSLYPALPIVIVGKGGSVQTIVRMMKAGASDVSLLPALNTSFVKVVLRNIKKKNSSLNNDMITTIGKTEVELIGKSKSIEEVRSAIELVSNSQTAVLITGESGTGKEIVARMIHTKSSRAKQPFVAINCAAIPKEIMENELFGHVTGAFTGAVKKKLGCFEAAHNGTLFFDEIAEMNPDTQAKLLRVLEQKSFRRLGGEEEIHVDVRTIGATNKNIQEALKRGEFREDLYYRFSVIEIPLPPLRERKDDIPLLVDYFLKLFKQKYNRQDKLIRDDALGYLMEYDWPGNIRELRNVIERTVVVSVNNIITPLDLPPAVLKKETNGSMVSIPLGTTLDKAEQLLIQKTLTHLNNNKSLTAKVLGLGRKTLYTKLQKMSGSRK